ncbi:MAG: RND family transporter [Candidatus Bipolaricaulia bacterium]
METLTNFVLRRRAPLLIAVLVLTVLLGIGVMRTELNGDFSTYLSQDSPLVQEFNRVDEVFKSNYIGMVLVKTDDVFTTENLTLIDQLTQAYGTIDGVDSATSLINVVALEKADDGSLRVGMLLEGKPFLDTPETLEQLRRYVLSQEMYVGTIINQAGTTAVILLRLAPQANHFNVADRIDQITQQIAPDTENIYYGGMPFLVYSMTGLIMDNLFFLVPLIILLLVGVLALSFRRLSGVLVPLVVVLLAVVWTVGILALLGRPIDMLVGIAPVILIAMGSADGIHFMRRFYEAHADGAGHREAVQITMKELGAPIVFTSITTIIGFGSLAISDFDIIRTFGWVTSLGIFLALVATLIVIPAGLSFGRGRTSASKADDDAQKPRSSRGESRIMAGLGRLIYRRPSAVALLTVGLVALLAVGIPRIVMNVDWSLCLARGSKPYQAEMLLRDEFGGSLPLLISVKGDIQDPITLETMYTIERYLNTLPNVSEATSIASILAEMNGALTGRFAVPADRDQVNNLWLLLRGQGFLDQMVRTDGQEALIQAKVASLGTAVISRAVEAADAFLDRLPRELIVVDVTQVSEAAREALNRPEAQQAAATLALSPEEYASLQAQYGMEAVRTVPLSAELTGLAPVLDRMEKELLPTQIESTLLALAAVTILLILIFRSPKAGLLGIVPVALTLLVNFAVLGYFGIGLDSFTAMVASITIGLGIDYAIHFTSRFRLEFERSGDEQAALLKTLQTTGVAILINSLSVGAGFAVLLLAGGQHIRLLGGLTALALLVSVLFTLIVLPALTLLWKPRYLKTPTIERTLHPAGSDL